ncbi:helix-turn-helix domain-containing protein [Rhizobium mayense]|uniref:AraC family transcriptional regulator n=1 Tax=Rhizobium mayense TaxID=1312184 RepID=A0ABT7K5V2_9HYPH|nr:AraC family transcriptional regulator [Rhizobium mayense]MDL2403532.1 AraC family transcriptional regulator [Rhizobium mayense]
MCSSSSAERSANQVRRSSPRSASHALEQHIRGRKIVQSTGDAWRDVEAQIFRRAQREDEVLVPAVAEPMLVWVMSGEATVEEREPDGDWRGGLVKAGSFYLTETDTPYLMRWQAAPEQPFEVMHLYLRLELVNRAALSMGLNASRLRMRDVSGARDMLISGILTGLADELQAPHEASPMFVKGMIESLTIHLLRHYAERDTATGRKPAQLPAWKLRKALEHMNAHLAEPFDLDQLADLCGMSRFHFSRAFHNTMGQSPSRWFILRRIEQAKEMLRDTDKQIIEIAMGVGYDSPSHFAKVFRSETGLSPKQYRTT